MRIDYRLTDCEAQPQTGPPTTSLTRHSIEFVEYLVLVGVRNADTSGSTASVKIMRSSSGCMLDLRSTREPSGEYFDCVAEEVGKHSDDLVIVSEDRRQIEGHVGNDPMAASGYSIALCDARTPP